MPHGEPVRCALHTLHFTPRGADLAAGMSRPSSRPHGFPAVGRLDVAVPPVPNSRDKKLDAKSNTEIPSGSACTGPGFFSIS